MNIRGRQRIRFFTHVLRLPAVYTQRLMYLMCVETKVRKSSWLNISYRDKLYHMTAIAYWAWLIYCRVASQSEKNQEYINIKKDIADKDTAYVYAHLAKRKRGRK